MTELRSWGTSQDLTERAELVVAELAANAVLHGRVPGRCFRLTLAYDPAAGRLRVEVSDARGDLGPRSLPAGTEPDPLSTTGRGLTLVTALADHWDCVPTHPAARPSGPCSPHRPKRDTPRPPRPHASASTPQGSTKRVITSQHQRMFSLRA
ncbi:ATP-binding protein [Streptomyces sp. INA 01156]